MVIPVAPLIQAAAAVTAVIGGAHLIDKIVEEIMGYSDPTYVIFDGDKDKWAYAYMKGWKENERINFDFRDAHDLTPMTSRAQDESYVKSHLRERMKGSKQAIVLVGESTKDLRKYVPWEIDLALEQDLPIIVVNLNGTRQMDSSRCPEVLRNKCVVHVDFKLKIIKHALDNWPTEYRRLTADVKAGGGRIYNSSIYANFGI